MERSPKLDLLDAETLIANYVCPGGDVTSHEKRGRVGIARAISPRCGPISTVVCSMGRHRCVLYIDTVVGANEDGVL